MKDLAVVLQVAVSFVLLGGSGLLVRTLYMLGKVDAGYDPHGVLTFLAIKDWNNSLPVDMRQAFLRAIQQRLLSIPGVTGVTAAPFLPLDGGFGGAVDWRTEGSLPAPPGSHAATLQSVLPGYFETLRTKLIAGRAFEERDNRPKSRVAIVDDLFAAKAFPHGLAVGKRVRLDFLDPPWVEIIGVAAHQRVASLATPGREEIFVTDGMAGFGVGRYWALRVSGNPAAKVPAVIAALAELDPQLLILDVQPMDAIVSKAGAANRFAFVLIGFFATAATLLATVGLHGALSALVRQRSSEIGVRMALGADTARIVRLVIAHGAWLTVTGMGAGVVGAFAATRLMTGMLVGVRPIDPVTFSAVTLIYVAIGGAACWGPSLRAARLNPISTLRQ